MDYVMLHALHDELEKIGGRFEQAGKWVATKGAPAIKKAPGKVVRGAEKAVNWLRAPVNPGAGRGYRVV